MAGVADDEHDLLAAQVADWLVAGEDGVHLVADGGCGVIADDDGDPVLLVALDDHNLPVAVHDADEDAVLIVTLDEQVLPVAGHDAYEDAILPVILDDHVLPVVVHDVD